jgi:hypothetical protein
MCTNSQTHQPMKPLKCIRPNETTALPREIYAADPRS